MAAPVTVLALAASAGPFLADKDADRVRRTCRHWRRAAELTPRVFLMRTYARTLRDPNATDEQRLAALLAVKAVCRVRGDMRNVFLIDQAMFDDMPVGLDDVADTVVATARPIIADITKYDPVGTAALLTLVATVGCSIPIRLDLIDRGIHLELCAALKQEAHEAMAIERQFFSLLALLPFCAKPFHPSRLSVLPEVPWERFIAPSHPHVVVAMALLALLSGPNDVIQAVPFNAGVLPLVVNCAKAGVAVPGCLRVLGNI